MPTPTRPDGDPGKPGRTGEEPIPAPPPRAPAPLPAVRPLDFERLAAAAMPPTSDPDYAPAVVREATRLDPVSRMKSLYTQTVSHAESIRRGEPWLYAGGFGLHAKDTIAAIRRHRDVLATAAGAADAALAQMTSELNALETAMADKANDDKGHPLTTDGSEHPLTAGRYDPNADPQLNVEDSDSAALKAGHTTRAQADAIARADTAPGSHTGGPDRPGTTPAPPTPAPASNPPAGSPGISTPNAVAAPQSTPNQAEARAATADNPLAKPPAEKK